MTAAPPDGLPQPRRTLAWLTVMLGLGMTVMDASSANVALPTIAADFRTSASASIWIVNAYQLALVVCLLPFAALAEIRGYRPVYLCGISVFASASLACAFAPSLPVLTAARVVQGIGAAGVMSINVALVRHIFPRALLGRAIGFNAMVAATASTIGPTYAGAVLGVLPWPWLFVLNVPLGALVLILGWRNLPDPEPASRRFDPAGAALTGCSIGLTVATAVGIGQGLPWPVVACSAAVAALATVTAVRRQASEAAPLLPIDLLRVPVFGLSIATSVGSFAAQMMAFTALPFHFSHDFGFSATTTGLLIMPWPLAVAVAAPVAGMLSDRIAAGWLGGAGLLALACGLVLLAMLPDDPSWLDIAWRMAICGAGFGTFQTSNNRTMVAASPRSRSGAASGMLSTARLSGQSLGAAMVALSLRTMPEGGAVLALAIAACLAVCGAAISVMRVRV